MRDKSKVIMYSQSVGNITLIFFVAAINMRMQLDVIFNIYYSFILIILTGNHLFYPKDRYWEKLYSNLMSFS